MWSGAGTALIAVIGIFAFGEAATALKLASIALIILGVIGLNLRGRVLVSPPADACDERRDPRTAAGRRRGGRAPRRRPRPSRSTRSPPRPASAKGGLLYHFPHRRDLVRGLVADWMERFEVEVEDAPPTTRALAAWTRAYLSGSDMTRVAPAERDAEFSLLAMLIDAPEELDSCASATARGRRASTTTASTRSTPPSPASPPTGCGSPTSSAWHPQRARRRAELLERMPKS